MGYDVIGFFYNPNIHPKKEYERRKMELKKIQNFFNVKILEGNYDVKRWFENVKGLEKEREGGKRCEICYKIRLEETAKKARSLGINVITTTLTVSPWKNSKKIFQIGKSISKEYNVKFLEIDFKKKDGFKKSITFSKILNLYRQKYCGCIFSFQKLLEKKR